MGGDLSEQYKLARDTQVYTTPASNGYSGGEMFVTLTFE
jgi:hypothetical protein